MEYRIGIGLFGKGSTNHLHRPEIVSAFLKRGFQVTYIVRDDYVPLLSRLEGCSYTTCRVRAETGWRLGVINFCQRVRAMYPARNRGHRQEFFGTTWVSLRPWTVARNLFCLFLACYRWGASLAAHVEASLFRPFLVDGLLHDSFDLLLLLGIGTVNSELEGAVTLWAERNHLPVVHCIGNYDNLTSKGFRGIIPECLLVWGPQMVDDAQKLHGISRSRVRIIGSLRYNSIRKSGNLKEKGSFFRDIGLDPERKTIVFAGFIYESQYFEVMEIYRQLHEKGNDCQLILRLYPNKVFMNSVFILPIMEYARSLPRVFVSCADPHFKNGSRDREVLQVEEKELWNILYHCDILIDFYSTIALEGAIFNKSLLRMHYEPPVARIEIKKAVPVAFWNLIHNKRIMSYGAIEIARSRAELIELLEKRLQQPAEFHSERKKMVNRECGPLDGGACERLINECLRIIKVEKTQGTNRTISR